MKELSIKEIQDVSVEILVHIDDICRKNDIDYSIYYGSLIGSERHQGYIPWDDDLDIVLTRPNYDRLIKLLANDETYLLLSLETREKYRYPFAKLVDKRTCVKTTQFYHSEDPDLGVFVDIFPIDGFPLDDSVRKAFGEKCSLYFDNMIGTLNASYAISKTRWKAYGKRILHYPKHRKLMKQGDYKHWKKLLMGEMSKYPIAETPICGYIEFVDEEWGVFPTEWFEHYEDVQFAGKTVRAIKDREKFLTLRYDDYMQLPPESERVTHHPYTFYWK
ncbi:LicD family protein [Enterococcus plantarum]|uniref:LicD family protein n=1 Tax=Enterococcus plantarum TaxID=1077675 RepID=UPI001A8CD9DD|nr:LicD family protein [Enterococcus plantarum]MBO0468647.1 LicD family protein [Enterococcus plantarum]